MNRDCTNLATPQREWCTQNTLSGPAERLAVVQPPLKKERFVREEGVRVPPTQDDWAWIKFFAHIFVKISVTPLLISDLGSIDINEKIITLLI